MTMQEYKAWRIGALVSAFLWIVMIFTNTWLVLTSLVGLVLASIFVGHWICKLSPSKNVRISYFISVFATMFVNKIADIPWWLAIFISFLAMILVAFVLLYVCTEVIASKKVRVYRNDHIKKYWRSYSNF